MAALDKFSYDNAISAAGKAIRKEMKIDNDTYIAASESANKSCRSAQSAYVSCLKGRESTPDACAKHLPSVVACLTAALPKPKPAAGAAPAAAAHH